MFFRFSLQARAGSPCHRGYKIPYFLNASVLLMPAFVKLFIPRYLAFLLPLSFAAAASGVSRMLRGITDASTAFTPRTRRLAGGVLGCAILLLVSAFPLRLMQRYNTWALTNGLSNEGYFRLRDVLAERHACSGKLFVEEPGRPLVSPSWVGLYAVDYVLSLSACEHRFLTAEKTMLALADRRDAWVVLSNDTAARWPKEWTLDSEFVFGAPAGFERVPITLYRARRGRRP